MEEKKSYVPYYVIPCWDRAKGDPAKADEYLDWLLASHDWEERNKKYNALTQSKEGDPYELYAWLRKLSEEGKADVKW